MDAATIIRSSHTRKETVQSQHRGALLRCRGSFSGSPRCIWNNSLLYTLYSVRWPVAWMRLSMAAGCGQGCPRTKSLYSRPGLSPSIFSHEDSAARACFFDFSTLFIPSSYVGGHGCSFARLRFFQVTYDRQTDHAVFRTLRSRFG